MGGLGVGADDTSIAVKRVRLHVTPFNSALLNKIIAPSLKPLASDISFHTIQTFPERDFGYVELPEMEAQKLKKKLNGSTLKGTKVKIEDAKLERKRKSDDEGDDATSNKKARKLPRKQKGWPKGPGLPNDFSGYELGRARHVKRGWSETTDNGQSPVRDEEPPVRDEDPHSSLEGKKLRFKTTLPPTTSPTETEKGVKKNRKEKNKKGRSGKNVVVEEFSKKRRLPQTPIQAAGPGFGALNYEDGKGWIDESGNVVEPERNSNRKESEGSEQGIERRISAIESREVADLLVAQNSARSNEANEEENMAVGEYATEQAAAAEPEKEKEVHPLEALFKRPTTRASDAASKPRPKPINTSFSFFDAEGRTADQEVGDEMMPPQTPHTKRDLEWRSIRSAAPTPDTAAIGRKFSFPGFGGSDDEDEELDVDPAVADEMDGVEQTSAGADALAAAGERGGEESAFRKWFYENRGDFNRGWKKRRRDEKKIERQRENRRVTRRVA